MSIPPKIPIETHREILQTYSKLDDILDNLLAEVRFIYGPNLAQNRALSNLKTARECTWAARNFVEAQMAYDYPDAFKSDGYLNDRQLNHDEEN